MQNERISSPISFMSHHQDGKSFEGKSKRGLFNNSQV
jgi:hypothetical protein